MTKEIVMECNNYSGVPSDERCRTVKEYVTEEIRSKCTLHNVIAKETQIQDNLIQPTLIVRYENGNDELLIQELDQILLDIGITAIKAVVSKIASRAAEAALVGGGVGLLAGSRSGGGALATTLVGVLLGGLIGSGIEKGIIELVAAKESGQWITEEIPQVRRG